MVESASPIGLLRPAVERTSLCSVDGSSTVELVLLRGGRADGALAEGPAPRGELRVVRGNPGDLRVAHEETAAAAREVRRELEARVAAALDGLLRVRAPAPGPR